MHDPGKKLCDGGEASLASPISQCTEIAACRLAAIEERIGQLYARLTPYMREQPPEEVAATAKQLPGDSEAAQQTQQLIKRCEVAVARMDDILRRLEL